MTDDTLTIGIASLLRTVHLLQTAGDGDGESALRKSALRPCQIFWPRPGRLGRLWYRLAKMPPCGNFIAAQDRMVRASLEHVKSDKVDRSLRSNFVYISFRLSGCPPISKGFAGTCVSRLSFIMLRVSSY
jgi:hypothetical protein